MKHPWHYWLLYGFGLVVVAVTLGWLTVQALLLDRAESAARRQAEIEESIGRALWRMDVRLMPLIATEAARPHFLYEPFYIPSDPKGRSLPEMRCASPLLTDRPEFVVLNFQLNAADEWTCPQVPSPEQQEEAVQAGASPHQLFESQLNLATLREETSYPSLLPLLPAESVIDSWNEVPPQNAPPPSPKIVNNAPVDENLAQQSVLPYLRVDGEPSASRGQPIPQVYSEASRLQRQQNLNTSDLANRDAQVQSLAQREFESQRANYGIAGNVREGISRPVWIGSRLLLARRVELNGQVLIQGSWLDWPRIKEVLLSEAADLLAVPDLQPVLEPTAAQANRMLATLPVQLVVSPPKLGAWNWSPMQTSLAIAWFFVMALAVAGGSLLHGVLSLSERRAAFVSAVTHELRTPLTTFRLYSEMLAQNMLPHPDQRQQYLETLRVESNRLARLVDNVLAYSRLERGRGGHLREALTVQALLDRCQERLVERAAQARLTFEIASETDVASVTVVTDSAAMEQILFNLVDNAAKYAGRGSEPRLQLTVRRHGKAVALELRDHGPGVLPSVTRRLFRPFSKSAEEAAHSAPGVGLGLALSRRLARQLGGDLTLADNSSAGACFRLTLPIASSADT